MAPLGRDLKSVFERAERLARTRGQRVGSAHVLFSLATGEGEVAKILSERGVSESAIRSALRGRREERSGALSVLQDRAARIARDFGSSHTGPLHLLLALTREPGTAAARCLASTGCNLPRLRASVEEALGRRVPIPVRSPPLVGLARPAAAGPRPPIPTAGAGAAATRPVVLSVRRPMPLARRAVPPGRPALPPRPHVPPRSSPTLVPAPSATSPVPDLDPKRFPFLSTLGRDLTAMASRGALDPVVGRAKELDRVLDVLHRREGSSPCLVGPSGVGKTAIVHGLAHRLLGGDVGSLFGRRLVEVPASELLAGTGTRGSLAERLAGLRREIARANGGILLFLDDIHAILGPSAAAETTAELRSALSRGEMSCIAATTPAEFRRTLEEDPALVRRLSRVDVEAPSREEALHVLRGVSVRYAAHHGLAIEDSALEAAVALGIRYLPGRELPEKAIAVVDLAAARTRRRGGEVVDVAVISEVISTLTGAPADRIGDTDHVRLLDLEARIAERVVGHEDAIRRIAAALRRNAAGFRRHRPIGSFLLLGPTGVGKTETARALADILFPEGSAMTRLDLGEYAEPHSISRMVGAPPGYVGHEDGGQLTEAVRNRPYQLVLLDEMEKAHPRVLTALLGLLEDGRLTDGRGRTVDFTNTVVVMTSNLGSEERPSGGVGFGSEESHARRLAERTVAAARRALPAELWNRLDETLFYAPLSRAEVAEIARRMLNATRRVLEDEHDVRLVFDERVVEALVDGGGWDPDLGARPMRRTVQRLVEDPLASRLLGGDLPPGTTVDGAALLASPPQSAR